MKLQHFFNYLSYGALAVFSSLLQKIFAALSKKCSALTHRAEDLLKKARQKIEALKDEKPTALAAALSAAFDGVYDGVYDGALSE